MSYLIQGGHVIDPANERDEVADVLVDNGEIQRIAQQIDPAGHHVISANGLSVIPGLVDVHVHLRQPGREDAETILTGSRSAVKGGVTSLCCMPNTQPPIDNAGLVEYVLTEAEKANLARVYPIGAITQGLKGEHLTEIGELVEMGCVGLSDDGHSVTNAAVMRRAMEYSRRFDVPVVPHCEDTDLSEGGCMHEGLTSLRLGLRGIPAESESTIVSRDLELARSTGARIHIAHVSTAASAEHIRRAKADGVRVTAETCPHYLVLTDEACATYDTNFKMNPPLACAQDQQAVREALRDGTIDCIATDHAPHPLYAKERDFASAPFGVIGLETSLAVCYTELVLSGFLSIQDLILRMSTWPARAYSLPGGALGVGDTADLALVDLNRTWRVIATDLESKSRNSPFLGRDVSGMVMATMVGGELVFEASGMTAAAPAMR